MHFVDIIEKKKRKEELTDEEIEFWISGYVDGIIPDYQVSADKVMKLQQFKKYKIKKKLQ